MTPPAPPPAHPPGTRTPDGREARVRRLFEAAIGAPADQRRAILDRARADQPSTCAEVESLLAFHDRDGGVLDKSAADAASSLGAPGWNAAPDAEGAPIPAQIGRYTVVRELGRGGMGVVYEADQEFPRRRVALKVLRPELVTPSLLRRFTHEVEALAMLRHPGIAPLYEAGFADGPARQRPFMAMELVEGRPITTHARERALPVRERVDLMARVCDAVEHAHLRGVIHRDLKPANILVNERGEPKVLDFGVARLTASRTGDSIATSAGQIIGTLGYMSPEQVAGDPRAIDARADVYALGAILYEVLAGRPALDASGLSLAEAALALRERTPEPLARIDTNFRGDLDTITGKALEKDAARRYQSPAALADDLRRYLAGEPIAARRDSSMYVMRKRLRQYRWGVAAAGAFLVLLAVFAAWASVQARRFRTLARSEGAAKAAAASNADALAAQLRSSNIERARLLVASGAAPDGEALLWTEHARDPGATDTRWALRDTYAHHPCRATLPGHDAPTEGVAVTADGRVAASGDRAGVVKIWDVRRAECTHTFEGPRGWVRSVALAPDGAVVYAAFADGQLRAWDLPEGRARDAVRVEPQGRFSLALSPDGRTLATGGAERTVRLWDAPTLTPIADLGEHPGGVFCLAFSPDGARLATAGAEGARLWDIPKRSPIGDIAGQRGIASLAFSPDGTRLASCGDMGSVRVFDLATLKPIAAIEPGQAWTIRSIAFTRDGRELVFSSWWNLYHCDAADKARPRQLATSSSIIAQFAMSGDRATVVSTAGDRMVRVWDLAPDGARQWLEPPAASRGYLHMATVTRDGSTIAVVNESGSPHLWRGADLAPLGPLPGSRGRVFDIAFSHDGSRLVCGGADGSVRVWDVAGRSIEREFPPGITVSNTRFSPDGRRLAVGRYEGRLTLYDTADWSTRAEIQTGGSATRMTRFTPDGSLLLATNASGTLMFVDPATGAELDRIREEMAFWALDISPDGGRYALGDGTRAVRIHDLASRRLLHRLEGHREIVWSVAFSSDGSLLASESSDGMLMLWDAPTGRRLITVFDDDQGLLFPVSFIPGTQRVLTGHGYRGAAIWDFARFDRFIAGNAEYQLARLRDSLPPAAIEQTRSWVASLEHQGQPGQ